MSIEKQSVRGGEFVAIMAVMMSLIALSIDAMLPALGLMVNDLNVKDPNHGQWIISSVFLGMSMGYMLYGPYSDAHGRKQAIYIGLIIFLAGSILSLYAERFEYMILGRLLQGLGGASFRVVSGSMIRDCFVGPDMARVMSLIMVLFILVPSLAPSIGQAILEIGSWRDIFTLFLLVGGVGGLWFGLRIDETLPQERRIPFTLKTLKSGITETLSHKKSLAYMLAGGLIFGSFVSYLSTSQQIFQDMYEQGKLFSLYFGGLAIAIGCSSFLNSRLVMKFSMERLCLLALLIKFTAAIVFMIFSITKLGRPPIASLVAYLVVTFFCLGTLFGNFNAIAMEPLGHIAGIANSVISSIQTLISVVIGAYLGSLFNLSVFPLVSGFAICSGLSLLLMLWTSHATKKSNFIESNIRI